MTVTIRECKSNGFEHTHTARTTDPVVAQRRAIEHHFGRGAYLVQDSGLGQGYGQIVRSVTRSGETWSATCLTDRVRVTVA
jgi:hypothetical protein